MKISQILLAVVVLTSVLNFTHLQNESLTGGNIKIASDRVAA
ncbi:phosphatase RapI regulator [Bacillus subtilis]|nr:phosphatase RapI regulator [Bacillus subtilis]